ncbi:hypothetical protein GCM10011494_29980 [Novosphingobium endophyticum]|uniref:Uncharacterized protein n=1 Tax=Novosphingobium endophyticum TaxID=1955250 RepID=A0A916X6J2_9SPHN|nr:hypothetical protein [Novosphingobium endophyticum]GGC09353.1 hypothetical protein GCM10011494_29980 [Novosphingobium endophyticum]
MADPSPVDRSKWLWIFLILIIFTVLVIWFWSMMGESYQLAGEEETGPDVEVIVPTAPEPEVPPTDIPAAD